MKHEKQTAHSPESLTRRQKLLGRAVPLALLTAGTIGFGAHELTSNKEAEPEVITATVTTEASTEFGGSESGWEQGAAERVFSEAFHEGVNAAFAEVAEVSAKNEGDFVVTPEEVDEIISSESTYEAARNLLEEAKSTGSLPDKGDKLAVELEVTANEDKYVTYVVKSASIEDIVNN